MAKHTAHLGLLALLVFAAAVHVTADDLTDALTSLKGVQKSLSGVQASLGSSPRGDKASRSDVTSCYGNSITCRYTARCTSSKCQCCSCPCATLTCWYNTVVKSAYNTAAKAVPLVKTPAQRQAVRKTFCDFSRAGAVGKFNLGLIDLYNKIKCPNYVAIVRSLRGWQTNFDKWCKAFSA